MSNEQLEDFFKSTMMVTLQPGNYSMFFSEEETPATITFRVPDTFIYEAFECISYIKKEYAPFNISIHILQKTELTLDFTILVDKDQSVVIKAEGIRCNNDNIKWFVKKQKPDKPMLWFLIINQKPTSIDRTVKLIDASKDADTYQAIHIHSWKVTPFETSD